MAERMRVREEFLDDREMSYKGLNDAKRQRALAPFLNAADLFPGNLFVFMVDKRILRLFDDPGEGVLFPELVVAVRNWNTKSFRRLLLVSTLGAVLVAGLAHPAQGLLWITDQDEIAPNSTKHDHAGFVVHHCLSTYAPTLRGLLTFATTEANVDTFLTADAVSIADLAAGSLVEVFNACPNAANRQLWRRPTASLSLKARVILDWFAQHGHVLRRVVVALDEAPGGRVVASAFRPLRTARDEVFLLR
jgi:hypothetical protein